jgi:hypothetical protein
MKLHLSIAFFLFSMFILLGCQPAKQKSNPDDVPHVLVKKLTDIIVVDIFTPPVASRIYANTALAMYEAMRHQREGYPSITAKLNAFDPMPLPDKKKQYDFILSGIRAFCETAKKVTFSADEINQFQDSMLIAYRGKVSEEVYLNSIAFGDAVAAVVAKRLATDQYKETRGMDRFDVKTDDRKRWVPTSPDYGDALEPHWLKMKTLALNSADEVKAAPYAEYSEDTTSGYYKELKEVYDISKNLTEEQIDIAIFWDDNPFVSRHKGHVMFQDKKMTPGGHWMAITKKACKDRGFDMNASAKAYAYTAVGLYDAFISCWYEKYRTVRIRPQTAIQRLMEEQWFSYIQTPPFPEYTSGHSTISSSAAEMLTHLFGDNYSFIDSSELEYNLPVRSFKSFRQAAMEASVSRVYGGIHYRSGCENGNAQGKQVAALAIKRIEQKN